MRVRSGGDRPCAAWSVAGFRFEDFDLEQGVVDLFGPSAYDRALSVERDRSVEVAEVAQRLGEVEDGAGVRRVAAQVFAQETFVADELVRSGAAVRVVFDDQLVEILVTVRRVGGEVFVRDALVAPWQPAAYQALDFADSA